MDSKSRVFPSETRRHETQTQDLVPVFVVGRLLCSTHFTHSPCAVRALLGFALLQGVLRGDPGMPGKSVLISTESGTIKLRGLTDLSDAAIVTAVKAKCDDLDELGKAVLSALGDEWTSLSQLLYNDEDNDWTNETVQFIEEELRTREGPFRFKPDTKPDPGDRGPGTAAGLGPPSAGRVRAHKKTATDEALPPVFTFGFKGTQDAPGKPVKLTVRMLPMTNRRGKTQTQRALLCLCLCVCVSLSALAPSPCAHTLCTANLSNLSCPPAPHQLPETT